MRYTEKEYPLDTRGVDAVSEACQEYLTQAGVSREDVQRVRLTAEELLLRVLEHYPEPRTVTLGLGKRFSRPVLRLSWKGEAFDPVVVGTGELDQWSGQILESLGLAPVWNGRNDTNEVILRAPATGHRAELLLAAAFVGAVVFGFLGGSLPPGFIAVVSDYILLPVSDIFTRLLSITVGLLVFLSVASGICGIGSTSSFTRLGKMLVTRSLLFTFLESALVVLLVIPFFSFQFGGGSGVGGNVKLLISLIVEVVPSNPVQPFLDNNMLQIIFLAALIGIILLITGSRSGHFREFVLDFNNVVMKAIEFICTLLPVYIFASLTLQFWDSGAESIVGLWRPIALCAGACCFLFALKLGVTCFRLKVSAGTLLPKLLPTMLVAFATASSAAAFSECSRVNEKELGISPQFSRIGIPIGNILYQAGYPTLFIIVAFYAAELYGTEVNVGWFLVAWFVCTLLSIAAPPVAGGTIACLSIILTQLGIPEAALAMAAALNVLLDFICTGVRMGMLHLELANQADRLGVIDYTILKRKAF